MWLEKFRRATSVALSLSFSPPLRSASRGLIRIALGCRSDEPWRAPRESNIDRRSSGLTPSQEGESGRREEGGERSRVAERGRERGGWLVVAGGSKGQRAQPWPKGAASLFLPLPLSLLVSPLPGRVPFSPFLSLSLCVPRSVCFARDFSWNPKFFVVTSFVSKFPFQRPFLRAI